LVFSREQSTLLDVGLIKIEPGESTTEDGFDCHVAVPTHFAGGPVPALEIGTPSSPIAAGVNALVRLRHHPGTNVQTLPAIVVCGGHWDVHGAPLNHTWTSLAASALPGENNITVDASVRDWHIGDRIIITSGEAQGPETGHSFEKRKFSRQKP